MTVKQSVFLIGLAVLMLVLILTHPAFGQASKVDTSEAAIAARRAARREAAKNLPATGGPCEAMPVPKGPPTPPPPPPKIFSGPEEIAEIGGPIGGATLYRAYDGDNVIYITLGPSGRSSMTVIKGR